MKKKKVVFLLDSWFEVRPGVKVNSRVDVPSLTVGFLLMDSLG
jgi:hypothetical protein